MHKVHPRHEPLAPPASLDETFEVVPDRALQPYERVVAALAPRWVPGFVSAPALAALGSLRWLSKDVRKPHLKWARWQLGDTAPPAELRALARRVLRRRTAERLVIHRTARYGPRRPEGLEPLVETLRSGRGALAVHAHQVDLRTLRLSVAAGGAPVLMVCGVPPAMWLRKSRSMDPCFRRINLRTEELGGRWIAAAGSFPALTAHLKDGGCVSIAADVGGSVPATLAGKRVSVSSATAALARLADVPVFPSFLVAEGGRGRLVTDAPLDPRQLGPEELQARLTQVLDTHISADLLSWQMPLSLRRTRQWDQA